MGNRKKRIVVVMGATGAGKSRLAVDLASSIQTNNNDDEVPLQFEIVNADSMQVYRGLDVLSNKIPIHQQKGVPHHLLGTVDPTVEFTSRQFRDLAIPIIDDIIARGRVPIVVGGTNYYIQALVSPFLIDDLVDVPDECCHIHVDDKEEELSESYKQCHIGTSNSDSFANYNLLNAIDPVAAKRVHPNNHRKVKHYLSLYATSSIPPSELLQSKAFNEKNWGQPVNFRYDCCFLWVDASLPVIDKCVDDRVDFMLKDGLLSEVFDIYSPTADYTRGLRQAIGVREFETFFSKYTSDNASVSGCDINCNVECTMPASAMNIRKFDKGDIKHLLDLDDEQRRALLDNAIKNLKANTRRLVRRQKRRINRLRTLYGWELHQIDVTEALAGNEGYWEREVVKPCISLVKDFLHDTGAAEMSFGQDSFWQKLEARDLWTQFVCEACGNRILRGAHEWEQHKLGRGHRKRISSLKLKSLSSQSQEDPYDVIN